MCADDGVVPELRPVVCQGLPRQQRWAQRTESHTTCSFLRSVLAPVITHVTQEVWRVWRNEGSAMKAEDKEHEEMKEGAYPRHHVSV